MKCEKKNHEKLIVVFLFFIRLFQKKKIEPIVNNFQTRLRYFLVSKHSSTITTSGFFPLLTDF